MPPVVAAPKAPLLIDVRAVAEMLGVSQTTVYRMDAQGIMPPRRKLGALVRWSRVEIEAWIVAGCPATDGTNK